MDDSENSMEEPLQRDYPSFHATGVSIVVTDMDFRLVFMEPHLAFQRQGAAVEDMDMGVKCVVSMSLHAAKDFHTRLNDSISRVEERFGPVSTPYLMDRLGQEENAEEEND